MNFMVAEGISHNRFLAKLILKSNHPVHPIRDMDDFSARFDGPLLLGQMSSNARWHRWWGWAPQGNHRSHGLLGPVSLFSLFLMNICTYNISIYIYIIVRTIIIIVIIIIVILIMIIIIMITMIIMIMIMIIMIIIIFIIHISLHFAFISHIYSTYLLDSLPARRGYLNFNRCNFFFFFFFLAFFFFFFFFRLVFLLVLYFFFSWCALLAARCDCVIQLLFNRCVPYRELRMQWATPGSEHMPDRPDRMPDRMPTYMSDRMFERLSDRMMSEHMSDRMPERMSERMSE